ncbi:MAG: hypothetical protein IT582_03530 [Opitutaceae bacterium]|nr:hypothetical protein [Opitutaceae bacterium]
MNPLWSLLLSGLWLCLAGCESMGGLGERFRPAEPALHNFESPLNSVYTSARQALQKMGFKITRASESSGRIDAVNGVRADATLRSSSQIEVRVALDSTLEGGTEMRVWMIEIVEDRFTQSGGYGIRSPLRASPLYEVLFRETAKVLGLPENN